MSRRSEAGYLPCKCCGKYMKGIFDYSPRKYCILCDDSDIKPPPIPKRAE